MVDYLHQGVRRSEVFAADLMLLEHLREERRLVGTKEGCASGDCGACTVVLVSLSDADKLDYRTVNSCICPATELQGCELITIEDLQQDGAQLHPIQQSFVEHHASQCGFCTPGFVMSTFALHKKTAQPNELQVEEALAGNLCRCTGYRPIVDAAMTPTPDYVDQFDRQESTRIKALRELRQPFSPIPDQGLSLPNSLEELASQIALWPDAEFIAGGTDLGLEITQNLARKPRLIGLSRIAELGQLEFDDQGNLTLGAALSYSALLELARDQEFEHLERFLLRIAAEQIRNRGTLGGNIANASPIGDLPPILLALDARLRLWSPENERELPITEFFLDYRKTALAENEIIVSVSFQMPKSGFIVEKVSKRRDDDISIISMAAVLEQQSTQLSDLKLAFGGMAATPMRAFHTEEFLKGRALGDLCELSLAQILEKDFTPMSDQRGSANYRIKVAASVLMQKLQQEWRGEA